MSFSLHSLSSSTLQTGIRRKAGLGIPKTMVQLWSLVPEVLSQACRESLATDKDLTASPSSPYCRTVRPPASSGRCSLSTEHRLVLAQSWTRGWELLAVIRHWLTDSFPQPPPPQPSPHASPPLPAVLCSLCSSTDTMLSGSNQTIRREPSRERRQGP